MLVVPPGTQPHSFISIPDEGFPITHQQGKRGYMMVKILVSVPLNVSAKITRPHVCTVINKVDSKTPQGPDLCKTNEFLVGSLKVPW